MTHEQAAAYVFAQSVAALAALEAMKAANAEREHRGEVIAYGEEAFRRLEEDYPIGHNAVFSVFARVDE